MDVARDIQIKTVPITSLIEDPKNARRHPASNILAIKDSLSRFGQVEPLVVRAGTSVVVGGNGRLQAMNAMGWQQAKIVELELTDAQAVALGISLNRTGDLADWDVDVLTELIDGLGADDLDLDALSLTTDDLDELMVGVAEHTRTSPSPVIQDDVPEPPKQPITRLGDVWLLGNCKLICGDSREHIAQGEDAHCVFTDPPYGVSYQSRVDDNIGKDWGAIEGDGLTGDSLIEMLKGTVPKSEFTYVCCPWDTYPEFVDALGKPKSVCVWDKGSIGLGYGYRRQFELVLFYGKLNRMDLSDVWGFSRESSYQHPTQKPVNLVAKALNDCGATSVYDPFAGSGTTLIAAQQLEISCVTVEIEPKYCDVVVERWENLTGGKATRTSTST